MARPLLAFLLFHPVFSLSHLCCITTLPAVVFSMPISAAHSSSFCFFLCSLVLNLSLFYKHACTSITNLLMFLKRIFCCWGHAKVFWILPLYVEYVFWMLYIISAVKWNQNKKKICTLFYFLADIYCFMSSLKMFKPAWWTTDWVVWPNKLFLYLWKIFFICCVLYNWSCIFKCLIFQN